MTNPFSYAKPVKNNLPEQKFKSGQYVVLKTNPYREKWQAMVTGTIQFMHGQWWYVVTFDAPQANDPTNQFNSIWMAESNLKDAE